MEIAKKAITELKPGTEFVLQEDRTLIPGAGPLVVLKADGSIHYLSTSVPPDRALKEFERRWRETKH